MQQHTSLQAAVDPVPLIDIEDDGDGDWEMMATCLHVLHGFWHCRKVVLISCWDTAS